MKFLTWLILVPVALAAVVFAVVNRQTVEIDLWPLPFSISPPLFVVVLASLFAGVLWGGIAAWISAGTNRRKARQMARRAESAERDLLYAHRETDGKPGATVKVPALPLKGDEGKSPDKGGSELILP